MAKRWEYLVERCMFRLSNGVRFADGHEITDWLNSYGAKGWEVVKMDRFDDSYMVTFKRPKKTQTNGLEVL